MIVIKLAWNISWYKPMKAPICKAVNKITFRHTIIGFHSSCAVAFNFIISVVSTAATSSYKTSEMEFVRAPIINNKKMNIPLNKTK
jgi:hypothetical protein